MKLNMHFLTDVLAGLCFATALWNQKFKCSLFAKVYGFSLVAFLMAMPFLHADGLNLFLYPFGLLDRLLGMSPSATIFAKEIAENNKVTVKGPKGTLERVLPKEMEIKMEQAEKIADAAAEKFTGDLKALVASATEEEFKEFIESESDFVHFSPPQTKPDMSLTKFCTAET